MARIVFETPKTNNYFVGYYDKVALSYDNAKLLACRVARIEKAPRKSEVLEIGYFDWKSSNKFFKLAETSAWNFQQGCMLQWLGPDYQRKIIYNDKVNEKFVSIVLDIRDNEKKILEMAYYDVSLDGKFALCIDNERHYWCRPGYNYQGIENVAKKTKIPVGDGVWHLDLKTNCLKQIVALSELLTIKPLSIMKHGYHYIEHLMISPNSQRFAFMHRFTLGDGGVYTRLYTASIDGSDIYLLNDSGRMSHYCWRSHNQILGWGATPSCANYLRKNDKVVKYFYRPMVRCYKAFSGGNSVDGNSSFSQIVSGDSYIILNDKTGEAVRVAQSKLTKDGHPTINYCNKDIMLSDTYPDSTTACEQELFLFDISKNKKTTIDLVAHNPEFRGAINRCDLHPKWSLDSRYICIDTLEDSVRKIRLYDMSTVN